MSDFGPLDAFIRRVRAMRLLPREVAKAAAPHVQEAIQDQIARGEDPDGKAWAPKKDGGRALEHAGAAVSTIAADTTIRTTLRGKEVFHHRGTSRVPQRRILPDSGDMPEHVKAALELGAAEAFQKLARGQ